MIIITALGLGVVINLTFAFYDLISKTIKMIKKFKRQIVQAYRVVKQTIKNIFIKPPLPKTKIIVKVIDRNESDIPLDTTPGQTYITEEQHIID